MRSWMFHKDHVDFPYPTPEVRARRKHEGGASRDVQETPPARIVLGTGCDSTQARGLGSNSLHAAATCAASVFALLGAQAPVRRMRIAALGTFRTKRDVLPPLQEKEAFAKQFSISTKQVNNWFTNARKRLWSKTHVQAASTAEAATPSFAAARAQRKYAEIEELSNGRISALEAKVGLTGGELDTPPASGGVSAPAVAAAQLAECAKELAEAAGVLHQAAESAQSRAQEQVVTHDRTLGGLLPAECVDVREVEASGQRVLAHLTSRKPTPSAVPPAPLLPAGAMVAAMHLRACTLASKKNLQQFTSSVRHCYAMLSALSALQDGVSAALAGRPAPGLLAMTRTLQEQERSLAQGWKARQVMRTVSGSTAASAASAVELEEQPATASPVAVSAPGTVSLMWGFDGDSCDFDDDLDFTTGMLLNLD